MLSQVSLKEPWIERESRDCAYINMICVSISCIDRFMHGRYKLIGTTHRAQSVARKIAETFVTPMNVFLCSERFELN